MHYFDAENGWRGMVSGVALIGAIVVLAICCFGGVYFWGRWLWSLA